MTHCNVYIDDEWIINSGCSYHIYQNRDWFTNYKAVNDSTILIGNNKPCKTIGMRTIQIRMHDGIVRILADV